MGKSRSKARSSSKKKTAKRSKAAHGGARDGAGRPRDKLPADVVARLKALPTSTPKEIRIWNATLLVEVQKLGIEGKISTELASTLRANAGSIDRALPAEPRPHNDGAGDDDDDDEDDGPELTEVAGDGAPLRIG